MVFVRPPKMNMLVQGNTITFPPRHVTNPARTSCKPRLDTIALLFGNGRDASVVGARRSEHR